MVSKQDASIANSALREFADERVARGIDARYINGAQGENGLEDKNDHESLPQNRFLWYADCTYRHHLTWQLIGM